MTAARRTACCPTPGSPAPFSCSMTAQKEPLLRQSALNVCHWLMLKQNERGYFDGDRVHATRGLADDGKFLPQPCSLDGAEAIRPLVMAFRATGNEVFVKAAWKIANFLMEERLPEFDAVAPPTVASVILSLIALDAEAPNARLRGALQDWGAWLRALPLSAQARGLNADGLHGGLYECARAGFLLHALFSDPAYWATPFTPWPWCRTRPARSPGRQWRLTRRRCSRWPACCPTRGPTSTPSGSAWAGACSRRTRPPTSFCASSARTAAPWIIFLWSAASTTSY